MAEGFLRDLAGDRFEVDSAGYEPSAEICGDAVEAMSEVGIDISGQRRSRWTRSWASVSPMPSRYAIARRSGHAPSSPA